MHTQLLIWVEWVINPIALYNSRKSQLWLGLSFFQPSPNLFVVRNMKWKITCSLFLLMIALGAFSVRSTAPKPLPIPANPQVIGNANKGWNYLIYGDFIKSGLPLPLFKLIQGKDPNNYLQRTGESAQIPHGFNLVQHENGTTIVVPTCLQCHAQEMDGQLFVGLGNTFLDFTQFGKERNGPAGFASNILKTMSPKWEESTSTIIRSFSTIGPLMQTEVVGVNAADRLATLLVAHRDPQSLEWKKNPVLPIPPEVTPTDVPAWWLLKKKNAMFYNGFGRGDFGKFLMLSNLLTVKDSAEAREVSKHFADVLAYIYSLEAPKYPKNIQIDLALKGEKIFNKNCSSCHGTYGEKSTYPNLLVPPEIIKTDTMLFSSNYQEPQFIDWFNKSWFAQGESPAQLVPGRGYVAPPLDGVWITAPYLHNGSVPTIEAVLNSQLRPTYWSRNFKNPQYDYNKLGWKYATHNAGQSKNIYNTTLPGYSNKGHYFGDHLTDDERKALIEYIKTL